MKIRGRTVGTTMPRSDWNQEDPKKSDYIFNKPNPVDYDKAQTLPDEKKAQARGNIDAAHIDDTKAGADAWSSKNTVDRLCPAFSESGSAVTCEPVEGYPLSVVSHIEPVQEGSGDPNPGGANLIVGTNYLDPSKWTGGSVDDGYNAEIFPLGDDFTSGQYCFSGSVEDGCTIGLAYFNEYPCEYETLATATGDFKQVVEVSFGEDFSYNRLALALVEQPAESVNSIHTLKLEKGTGGNLRPITGHSAVTLTRNGEEFTVALGQTVYGGSLNWATGVLTLDWKLKTFTGKEAAWNRYITATADTTGFSITISDKKVGFKTSICNMFKNTNNLNAYAKEYMEHGLYTDHRELQNCYFDWGPYYPSSQSTAALAGFKAWLQEMYAAGTPVELCYQLAEPVTVQLKAQEILALSGTNTLYSDTGDTEVTGRADPTAVIEKLTNAIIALGGNV